MVALIGPTRFRSIGDSEPPLHGKTFDGLEFEGSPHGPPPHRMLGFARKLPDFLQDYRR